ncbi:hypothetical protein DD237_008538 [Peronospora effusa]|uniref:Uncharacterized protein n=1 Tax=Peronospora effusa TaxID=542832 RepID=A0A425C2P8_9STRA|nr:hypothetical protein DD237_008538 [Peronospora effusa]
MSCAGQSAQISFCEVAATLTADVAIVNRLVKEGRVKINKDSVCDVCATATQVRKTFKVNEEDFEVRESALSDAVVCLDVLETFTPTLRSGFKYAVTFIMMKSRYVMIYSLRKKSYVYQNVVRDIDQGTKKRQWWQFLKRWYGPLLQVKVHQAYILSAIQSRAKWDVKEYKPHTPGDDTLYAEGQRAQQVLLIRGDDDSCENSLRSV